MNASSASSDSAAADATDAQVRPAEPAPPAPETAHGEEHEAGAEASSGEATSLEGADDPEAALRRIALDEDNASQGLAELVLTLIKLIHDLLEKQAVRRMENGTLTDDEVERIGQTLMQQADELERLCDIFGLELSDLDLDLGPIRVTDS